MGIMKTELTPDSKPEFIGQIIDRFEDYLEEKGIELENDERDEAIAEGEIDPDEAAMIYGSYYDMIGDVISDIIKTHDLMSGGFMSGKTVDCVITDIMDSFQEVLKMGECEEPVSNSDSNDLKDFIHDTFERWSLIS